MECPKCKLPYSGEGRMPLLLVNCGHTLCRCCVEKLYVQNSVTCIECGKATTLLSIDNFPKNMALLLIAQKSETSTVSEKQNSGARCNCEVHGKELEAFCEDDFQLLCIDCILLNNHKDHAIASIKEASQKAREDLCKTCENATKNAETLTGLLSKAHTFREEIEKIASARKEQIQQIYVEFYKLAQARESQLKKDVEQALTKYSEIISDKITQINQQLSTIDSLKNETSLSKDETDYELLKKAKDRNALASASNATLPKINLVPAFPDITREKEVLALCRSLVVMQDGHNKPKPAFVKSPTHVNEKKTTPATPITNRNKKRSFKGHNNFSSKHTFNSPAANGTSTTTKNSINPLPSFPPLATHNGKPEAKNACLEKPTFSQTGRNSVIDPQDTPETEGKAALYESLTPRVVLPGREFLRNFPPKNQAPELKFSCPELSEISMRKTPSDGCSFSHGSIILGDDQSVDNPSEITLELNTQLSADKSVAEEVKYNVSPLSEANSFDSKDCSSGFMFTLPKRSNKFIYVFSGYGLNDCEKFDIERNTWKSISPISKSRSKFSVGIAVAGHMLIIGGLILGDKRTDTVQEYNPITNKWITSGIKLTEPKHSFGISCTSTRLYVAGGSAGRVLNTFESLDLYTRLWKTLPPMRYKRESHSLVIGQDGRLYAIGGSNGKNSLASVERYNPQLGRWEDIAFLHTKRQGHSAVAINGSIMVIGGMSNGKYVNSIEFFKIGKNEWEYGSSMHTARTDFASIVTSEGRYVYVMGGYNGKPLAECERYDLWENKWEIIPGMINKRHMHAAAFCPVSVQDENRFLV